MATQLKQSAKRGNFEFVDQILEKIKNFIVIIDTEYKVIWVNKAFENHTGYTLDEIYQKVPGEFLQGPGTDQNTLHEMHLAASDGRYYQVELLNYTKTKDPYWVQIDCTPIFNDQKLVAYIEIQSDISLRKAEEIKTSNYNKFLLDLLEDISHELRSPLTSILGLNEVIRYSRTFEEKEEIFKLLNNSVIELDEMIKQMNIKIFNELNMSN